MSTHIAQNISERLLRVMHHRECRDFVRVRHQGNGTAACFADDARVFTFSMHARHNYPLQKETSTLDVELDDGADDEAVLAALEAHVPEALDRHAPDLVFYQAGVQAVMEHLHEEMVRAMRLSGTPSLADATPDLVMR